MEKIELKTVVDAGGVAAKSERRVGSYERGGERPGGRKGSKAVVEDALRRFEADGRTSNLALARLTKWILELDASEFPEVMEMLMELERAAAVDSEASFYFGSSGQDQFVQLGLGGWNNQRAR